MKWFPKFLTRKKQALADVSNDYVKGVIDATNRKEGNKKGDYPFSTVAYETKPLTAAVFSRAQNEVYKAPNSRYNLTQLYNRLFFDLSVEHSISSIINSISPWGIDLYHRKTNKKAPYEVNDLINHDWIRIVKKEWIYHEYFGVTVLQVNLNRKGEVYKISSVDRGWIDTYSKVLRTPDQQFQFDGEEQEKKPAINYIEDKNYTEILYENNPFAIGKLAAIAKVILPKINAMTSWQILLEGIANPILVIKTTGSNMQPTENVIEILKTPSSSRVIAIGDKDDAYLLQLKDQDNWAVFSKLIETSQTAVTKSITGEDISNSSVNNASSAEALERKQNMFTQSIRANFAFYMQDKFFPFLENIPGRNMYKELKISDYVLRIKPDPITLVNASNSRTSAPSKEEKKSGNVNSS